MTLRRNFSWTLLGNVIYAGCRWGVVTALAKLGDPTMVGQFALALAITAPIVQFSNLQLRAVQATDAGDEYRFADYFSLRTITATLALIACIFAAGYWGSSTETILVILIVAIAKIADAFGDVFYGYFQKREYMDLVSQALIANGLLSLFLISVGVFLTGNIVVGTVGYAIGSIVPAIVITVPNAKRLFHREFGQRSRFFSFLTHTSGVGSVWALARQSLPLGFVILLTSLNSIVPRYALETGHGEFTLGIFAALAYLIVAGTTVVTAVGQAVSPRLSRLYAFGSIDQFKRMIVILIGAGLVLGICGAGVASIAGSRILSILYSAEYAEYDDALVLMSLAAGFSFAASFAGYGLTAMRRFRVQVPISAMVLLVTVGVSVLLVPDGGVRGGAGVLLVSSSTMLGFFLVTLWHSLNNEVP